MRHQTNPEHEQIFFGVEYHFLAEANSEHGGIVEGYGATFGHPLDGDPRIVLDAGAFKKTIPERIKRAGGSMVPYLDSHEWTNAHVLGTVVDAAPKIPRASVSNRSFRKRRPPRTRSSRCARGTSR